MTLIQLLDRWRAEPTIFGNITAWEEIPGRAARFVAFPTDLHPLLKQRLGDRGIQALYTHQEEAWKRARTGENIVVVTGTASGKTLCYNLPVLNQLFLDDQARSLYIFPTKALAQDQLEELVGYSGISAAVYDGDTPVRHRPAIRENSRLIITNPDMVHTGILPHHTRWESLFRNLKYIVLDEIHAYRGVFGSHVANVIRRLKRIAGHYGSSPQFILTSATIANPIELAEKLIEAPVTLISQDGSARGPKQFLMYNPPIVDSELGLRRSSLLESVRLADDLLRYNIQIIVFGRSRRAVELILTYLREENSTASLASSARDRSPFRPGTERTIRGYRSGYLPEVRREIERGLREEVVRAVVATNALELGIDIGQMGASILVGYPGSIASTWQQAGRAGRGSEESLTLFVTSANPLDQFLAHHPDYLLGRSPEQALINPDNLLVILAHIRCALFELPFGEGETFGKMAAGEFREILEFLESEGSVHKSGSKYFWMAEGYPAEGVPLRTASPKRVSLQASADGRSVSIGEVDYESAHWMVHPQAIYLHESEAYLVEALDLELGIAHLSRTTVDYYTEPRTDTTIQLLELKDQVSIPGGRKAWGEILVTSQLKGFRRRRWFTHETLGIDDLDLPPVDLRTTGYWITLAPNAVDQLRESGLWLNDPNQYGPAWNQIRELIRARDQYRCQVCGILEERQVHHVHHKTPFRYYSSAEEANQLDNLITLCPSCHRKVELSVRLRSGLSGLAYVVGNLAPLFLMCDSRDLGVFSDPKAAFAEGEPAIVIFEHIPAGIGFSARLFEIHSELIENARELVATCDCFDGCPSCVGPSGENASGGKEAALAILDLLIAE
jgi:DEAD/DEAH box helicase domain-containing protein